MVVTYGIKSLINKHKAIMWIKYVPYNNIKIKKI